MKTLWESLPGDTALVAQVDEALPAVVMNRLSDIGIEPDAPLYCLRRSPFGGPLVVLVADCVYTLDQQIASRIYLQAAAAAPSVN